MIYLVAWSGNNEDVCLCLWFLSLAFSWYIKFWTLPLYGFWMWIVHERKYHCTEKKGRSVIISKMTVHVCSLAPVIVEIIFWWLLTKCNMVAILGIKDFLKWYVLKLMWLHHYQHHCDLWLACKHTWWTSSDTHLNVGKKFVTSSQQFTSQLLGKWKQFLFLGAVVWQQSNIIQQGVFCFQT